jgi:hypothetical protein
VWVDAVERQPQHHHDDDQTGFEGNGNDHNRQHHHDDHGSL